MFKQVQRDCDVKINVLIRPRFGDFLYTEPEMEEMCEEIKMFRDLGANGVVIGTLTPDGQLDLEKMRRLMDCAGGIDVTLHRAFDMTRDPYETLEAAVSLGCKTILTSGQEKDVVAGKDTLKGVYAKAAGRIDIMAGCGVKKWNIQEIHDHTGIIVFHTTGRKDPLDSGMVSPPSRNTSVRVTRRTQARFTMQDRPVRKNRSSSSRWNSPRGFFTV